MLYCARVEVETVLQVNGMGPFDVVYPDLFTLTWPEQSWRRLDERDGDTACIV